MGDNRGQTYHRITVIMWISLLLTVPTWIYGIINVFDLRAFNQQMIEGGLLGKLNLLAITSTMLPILGLILALVARALISVEKSKYNFYPSKSKQPFYNNILIGYFIVLFLIGVVYLMHS
jgi:hypothetical protein